AGAGLGAGGGDVAGRLAGGTGRRRCAAGRSRAVWGLRRRTPADGGQRRGGPGALAVTAPLRRRRRLRRTRVAGRRRPPLPPVLQVPARVRRRRQRRVRAGVRPAAAAGVGGTATYGGG